MRWTGCSERWDATLPADRTPRPRDGEKVGTLGVAVDGALDDALGDALDDAVRALGHPGRRAMLRLARDGEQSASDLAEAAGLSPSAASPHLKLLREAGLLQMRVDAKRRLYRVDHDRLAGVRAALDDLWDDRLAALQRHAEASPTPRRRQRGRTA